jgi:hypothetical protein
MITVRVLDRRTGEPVKDVRLSLALKYQLLDSNIQYTRLSGSSVWFLYSGDVDVC